MIRTAIAASAAVTLGALLAGGVLARPATQAGPGQFSVSGSVRGLYPGGTAWLPAAVRNPYRRPLRLISLTVLAHGARGCPRDNIRVRPMAGRITIPPGRTRVVRLLVRMSRTAPQSCAGARFPLTFRGRGSVG